MMKYIWTGWKLSIPYRFLHLKPVTHLPVNGQDTAAPGLGLPWIETNLVPFEIHLVPAQPAKFTQPVTQMICNHEEWPQIIRELISKP